ncbi:hypothetical protein Tco_0618623 [Tanacetum coccineum]
MASRKATKQLWFQYQMQLRMKKVGNKTFKIYNVDHAICERYRKFSNFNSIRLLSGPTAISIKGEAASAWEILFKGTSCSVIHEWNNISSSEQQINATIGTGPLEHMWTESKNIQ